MTRAIAHRGPDGSGIWISDEGKVGLGHRRLSIIDLSDAGAQPMVSASQRFTLSFNGEIYNFVELRQELESRGHRFRGHSDTEVMLAGFEAWGIEPTLRRLSGMFALAVWDREQKSLLIARDRLGIKPLYYGMAGGGLAFASELRAIVAYRGSLPTISAPALNEYLRLGYVPGALSIFEGVHKLLPGHYAVFRNGALSTPAPFWQLDQVVLAGLSNRFADEATAIESLDRALRASVKSHMVSDVPLGAFLSGGIDSSTVVALMQSVSSRPVKTFSIGFHDKRYNEAECAAAVARHLGTDHTEHYVTEADALAVIPQIPDIYDEPFADASQIPTFLVSRMARDQVKVVLSGDGGDELFAGYNRYLFVAGFWHRLQALPLPLRRGLSRAVASVSAAAWDRLFDRVRPVLPGRFSPSLPGQKMHKMAAVLPAATLLELHRRLVAQWAVPETVLEPSWVADNGQAVDAFAHVTPLSDIERQMLWDTRTYLVDDVLTKVDRASMRVGLEVRVPFLDHQMLDFAWRVPVGMKTRQDGGKWLLRQVLYRYVPRELIDRPKMGFSVPIDGWLRGPLRDWATSCLAADRLRSDGILNGSQVDLVLRRHLEGSVEAGGSLWTLLMFQAWLESVRKWV